MSSSTLTSTARPGGGVGSDVTIVFVHGAWHGPWCWEGWGEAARAEGFATASLTLPGHDRPGTRSRIWPRLSRYVDHVRTVVDAIDGPVVVVGHSMGGYVTQRMLEDAPANVRGAVLVAALPRGGIAGAMVRFLRAQPLGTLRALATADLYRIVDGQVAVRSWFFCPSTTEDVVSRCRERLQNESFLAVWPMLARFPRPRAVDVPVMVLAAEDDAIFSVRSQRRLAKAYGTTAQVVPGGHDVMLDVAAGGAGHLVLDWVRRTPR